MWHRLIIPFLTLVIGAQLFLYDFLRLNGERDLILEETMMQPPFLNPNNRLEFLHIPKTGGTMLESLAGNNNVTWGACHFPSIPLKWKNPPKGEPWVSCPRTARNNTFPSLDLNPWHLPIHVLRHRLSFDPYDNIPPELAARPKKFFTVIRNPYDRIISTYYYVHAGPNFPNVNDSKELNAFILNEIRDKMCLTAGPACLKENKCRGMFSCGTQHDFIFDGEKRVIDHVLHYETLQEDFEELSNLYSLNFTISNKKPQKKHRVLTAANLTDDSIRFINSMFRKDFDLGRGYKMIQVNDKDIRDQETVAAESITNKESIKPRLEFLHIPKTGGTMLETLAAKNNVSWGACHFTEVLNASSIRQLTLPWKHCPPAVQPKTFPLQEYSYWHVPTYILPHLLPFDPYHNVSPSLVARPKRFFTVIRNPYDRMVSIYYHFNALKKRAHNPQRMNDFILNEIRNKSCTYVPKCFSECWCYGLFECGTQHDFIFNGSGNRVVDHILHYETLRKDFAELSKLYAINFTIPEKEPPMIKRVLTAANLSDDSIRFINQKFRKDFDLGHGYEMIHPDEKLRADIV